MNLKVANLNLPNFDDLTVDVLAQHIQQYLEQGESFLGALIDVPKTIEDKLAVLDRLTLIDASLSEHWGILSHLNAVMSTPEVRETYQHWLPRLNEYYTRLGQHEPLYLIYQCIESHEMFSDLTHDLQQVIRLELRNFRLSGVGLPNEKKEMFARNSSRLSQLSSEFANHVLDATQQYVRIVTEEELEGLPESSVALLKQYGQQKGYDQPVITLDAPAYIAVMTYARNRALREEVYGAYVKRASELGEQSEFDNSLIMEEILSLRQEQAALLGFQHYGELSLSKKMAPDVNTVRTFLLDLAEHARQSALQDVQALQQLAQLDGVESLQPWDIFYYSDQLEQQRFNVSQDALRAYFPVPRVLSGLFAIVKKLYNVDVVQKQATVWHDDVMYFELEEDGQVLGGFYLDLYARQAKRGGAWMSGFRPRGVLAGVLQKPVCFMVANFNPPIADQSACLRHNEVVTLFHEFGHGLHHLLTEVNHIGVSGTNGVAWDAVELPSQFMEFWAWEKEGLSLLSQHVETQQPLPEPVLESLLQVKLFQTGMQTLRQIELALFDLDIHCAVPALTCTQIQETLDRIRQTISVIPTVAYNRFQHGFSHIFAGGYACGYYSYKWAEVLASDAFSRFEAEGVFNKETGRAFREEILAVGGQVDALQAFVRFRGREPSIQALLKHQGWIYD